MTKITFENIPDVRAFYLNPQDHANDAYMCDFTKAEPWRIFRIMAEFIDSFETMSKYRKLVPIFGSARLKEDSPWYRDCVRLGEMLAEAGYGVLASIFSDEYIHSAIIIVCTERSFTYHIATFFHQRLGFVYHRRNVEFAILFKCRHFHEVTEQLHSEVAHHIALCETSFYAFIYHGTFRFVNTKPQRLRTLAELDKF